MWSSESLGWNQQTHVKVQLSSMPFQLDVDLLLGTTKQPHQLCNPKHPLRYDLFKQRVLLPSAVISHFVEKRPSLEWVKKKIKHWSLSRPYLVSLAVKGLFIFRFNSPKDKSYIVFLYKLWFGQSWNYE